MASLQLTDAELERLADAVAARLAPMLERISAEPQPVSPTDWMTLKEAAALFDCGDYVLREAIINDELKAYRPGKSWRIRRADLEAWATGRAKRRPRNLIANLRGGAA